MLCQPGPSPEAELRALAWDNTQLLINQLWRLPTERVEEAMVARLLEPATRLPREKPLPRPWRLTRWQQFMRLKGISPKKKTNLLWEEASGQWLRRWGYKLAWDDTKEWVIEVPGSSNPMEDQFAKRTQAKKERVAKNELNRLRNLARVHKMQMPSSAGLHPTGHQSKEELCLAMQVAKVSTDSVGCFQECLPKEKAPRGSCKKRKFQPFFGDFAAEIKEPVGATLSHEQQETSAGRDKGHQQADEGRGPRGGCQEEENEPER